MTGLAGSRVRASWVDFLKAILAVLVVLHHARTAAEDFGARLPVLHTFDAVTIKICMPGFMLLSGLFAAKAVSGPALALWRDRVLYLLYLCSVWAALTVVVGATGAIVLGRSVADAINRFLLRVIDGVAPLWFLLALACFFAIARVIRNLSVFVQFGIAVVLAAAVSMPLVPGLIAHLWLLGFFLFGLHFRVICDGVAHNVGVDALSSTRPGIAAAWMGERSLAIYLVHPVALPVVFRLVPLNNLGVVVSTVGMVTLGLVAFTALGRVPGVFSLPRIGRQSARATSS